MAEFMNLDNDDIVKMHKRPVNRQRLGLDDLNDDELRRRYRFDREGILYITDLRRRELTHDTQRLLTCTPKLQVRPN